MFNGMACCGLKEMVNIKTGFERAKKDRKGLPVDGAHECMKLFMSWWFNNPVTTRPVPNSRRDDWVLLGPRQFHIPGAHVIFTDANDRPYKYGFRLARYIRKHDLGDLACSKPRANRNYWHDTEMKKPTRRDPHIITCWIWTPKTETLKRWCEENVPDAYDVEKAGLQPVPDGYVTYGVPYPFERVHFGLPPLPAEPVQAAVQVRL